MKTTTAIVQLLKDSPDWRTFFKRCANTSAFRLRTQAWQFREEIAERSFVVAELGTVQDALFELARDLFPHSPGADFITWAGLLCGDAMARMQEYYQVLSTGERAAVDISGAWCHNDAIEEACRNENLAALREALKDYEREVLQALRAREEGAA